MHEQLRKKRLTVGLSGDHSFLWRYSGTGELVKFFPESTIIPGSRSQWKILRKKNGIYTWSPLRLGGALVAFIGELDPYDCECFIRVGKIL